MSKKKQDYRLIKITPLFFAAWIFTYGNRMILSPLLKEFEKIWQLSPSQLGYMSGALFVSYFLFQIPCGILADNWSRKKTFVLGLFLHGTAVILSGIAPNAGFFILTRILTGIAQATLFASSFSILSDLLPPRRRVLGMAIAHAGMPMGIVYGMVLSSYLTYELQYPWNVSFILSGVSTLFLAVAAYLTLNHYSEVKKDLEVKRNVYEQVSKKNKLRQVASNRNIMILSLVGMLDSYGVYLVLTWMPYYLTTKGFAEGQAGLLSSLSSFLSVPGCIIMALLADRIGQRKRIILTLMPVTIVMLFIVSQTHSVPILAGSLLLYGLLGRLSIGPIHIALIAELSDPSQYSTALSITNTFASASFFMAPMITGWLLQVTQTLEAGIYFAIFLQMVALGLMAFGVKEKNL